MEGPEGLFLWKVLKAKGAEFAKHPRGYAQIHLGHKRERLTALPGWEMTNNYEELKRAECLHQRRPSKGGCSLKGSLPLGEKEGDWWRSGSAEPTPTFQVTSTETGVPH